MPTTPPAINRNDLVAKRARELEAFPRERGVIPCHRESQRMVACTLLENPRRGLSAATRLPRLGVAR